MLMRSSPYRSPNFYSHHKSDKQANLPSTHHKVAHSPESLRRSSRSPPHRSVPTISQNLLTLETQKQRCMQMRRYSLAERLDKQIRRVRTQLASSRVSRVVEQQKEERRAISQAHKNQIRYFQHTWSNYFHQLQERESLILQSFKQDQERQVYEAQLRVRRRCRSLHIPRKQIIDLKQKEKILRKTGDFSYLKYVKKQLAEAVLKERREKMKVMEHFAQIQQERLSMTQSKKYSVLVRRLEEYRQDKERVYLRQQKRLKQKYKNVVQQLHHDQTIELEQTNKLALAMQF